MSNATTPLVLRKATSAEIPAIWEILQEAIEQRRQDGSSQWQDGYPNELSIASDIKNGYAYVGTKEQTIIAYAAIIFDKEPVYEDIKGQWLTDGDYVVVHRVAVSKLTKGQGIATLLFKSIEDLARKHKTYSIKVDTNFDNVPMLRILDKLAYTYCGEVFFRGAPRKAYEKKLL